MPTVTIDGKAIEFEGRPKSLLQFALDHDIEIPYFCYHPAMSSPTNCRMCLVEVGFHARDRATGEFQNDEEGNPIIQWGRKPSTACNTPVGDRMFVKTHRTSPTIKTAQEGVLEYMLINHPLDCPICDQAGECPLQIWTYKYGREGSRFENLKVHKKKHVELGPRVILDEERCINCTRCVRFTEEISKSNQLTMIGRGDRNRPATAPGMSFDEPYSMNTIDLCPVGALTSKAHRFKARVWEMAYSPAIDMNDATGSNIYVWVRDNKVMRITARKNSEVNEYWIPDAYRLNVDFYNENRTSGVTVKGMPVPFEDGLKKAAQILQGAGKDTMLLGSAYASLESNFALKQFAEQVGISKIYYIPHVEQGAGDGWLMNDDRTPNAAACEMLGFEALTIEEFKSKASKANALYALENDRALAELGDALDRMPVIAHSTHNSELYTKVDVLLPAALSIEGEGTFINAKGAAQVSKMARQIRQMTPEQWMSIPKSRLDKAAVAVDNWRNLENIFDVLPSWDLTSRVGRYMGFDLSYKEHRDIFAAAKREFEVLKDIKVSYKPSKEAFKFTQLEYAPRW
ncbi:2Fe-2S iron-sulfur cluster-binding protein [Pontibacter sp. G13]|uniref:2Fe-2S iron-sulfur cluster-binding protein n=1 Tax=Pontibacter sp. G13 TaxID=3074898 RepID=UPI00288C4D0C|nr:2Fe-2S iron-sulfur cluster-binding protein [Pontibacter sp. G13]WNJ16935.1 2Fe-2S iron-sulfur cluster-binding protein [Pontibacter sp. G13]